MPFCPKCGTEYQEGSKFCAKCGGNLDGSVAPVPVNQGNGFFHKILDTKNITSTFEAEDINAGKGMSILAYCAVLAYLLVSWIFGGFLAFIVMAGMLVAPCILAKKSKFLQYHLSMIFPAILGVFAVEAIESFISGKLFWAVYWGLSFSASNFVATLVGVILAWLIHIIFMGIPIMILVIGLMNAIGGKAKDLPLIGRFKLIFEAKETKDKE